MKRPLILARASVLLVLLLTVACAGAAFGQPTLLTDKWDYTAGDVVHITGAGWGPGEMVSLTVHEDPELHAPAVLSATADEYGNIASAGFVIAPGDSAIRFTLDALGETSGLTAQARFVDSPWIQIGWDPLIPGQQPNPVRPGQTATYQIKVQVATGSSLQANLWIVSGLPAGATGSFSPNPLVFSGSTSLGTSTLTIVTSAGTPLGDWPVRVRAEKVGATTDFYDFIAVLGVRNSDFLIEPVMSGLGPRANEQLGYQATPAGDFNADGYPDIMVETYNTAVNWSGALYLHYGGPAADNVPDLVFTSPAGPGDRFGEIAEYIGDVNADGYDDVAITSCQYLNYVGRVYVYYGGPNPDTTPDLTVQGTAANQDFGGALASKCDVNNDGYSDLVVGAPFAAYVRVYYGGPGFDAVPDLQYSGALGGFFGNYINSPGDLNGDGLQDLVIAANRQTLRQGRAYVYFGSRPPHTTPDLTMSSTYNSGYFPGQVRPAGDLNHDGYADVLMSHTAWPAEYAPPTGRALVYFGGPNMDNVEDLTFYGESPGDWFGTGEGVGDLNGDGNDDLMLASGTNDLGGTDAGRLYVYFGGPGMDNVPDLTLAGERTGDLFGAFPRRTGGDFNADGREEILVGAFANNEAGAYAGKFYVFAAGRLNRPPTLLAIPDQEIAEGSLLSVPAVATDPDVPAQPLTFALVDGPPGSGIHPTTGVFTWIPTEVQGPGDYPVTIEVSDNGTPLLSDQKSFFIHVNEVNLPPVVTVPGPITVDEGGTVSFTATATDPDLPANTLSFALVPPSPPGAGIDPASGAVTWVTSDNGAFILRVAVNDGHGGTSTGDVPLTVANVAPTVTILGPPASVIYPVGNSVAFSGAFADPGTADTHTAAWSLDGITVPGVVDEAARTVGGSHTFVAAGVYMVRLTVTDDDGSSGTCTQVGGLDAMVVVYDPHGGFVTGHGWITSPAGAYLPDPTAHGMAIFGFFAKYLRGMQAPQSETQFQFRAGDLRLQSSDCEWLVVAGARAQYKGTGTINGVGDYGFLMTAVDGDVLGGDRPDRLRMKIWDRATEALVYDNQLGAPDTTGPVTALGAGQIVVQAGGGTGKQAISATAAPQMPERVALPFAYSLGQNRPNPFAADTRIEFALPERGRVHLAIYDLSGRMVARLLDEERPAGRHQIEWTGASDDGTRARPGVYFYRIVLEPAGTGPNFSALRKMVLLGN